MPVTIKALEVENVKRVKAVTIEPTASGLTIIGGKNNQGKTSILDSIMWGLGGEKYRPSIAQRDGSVIPPHLKITLSNGLVVERSGKNSALKVTDPNGRKSGQQLLNSFVEVLALDLPKFMGSSSKDKASTLLKIIGVGDTLHELEYEEQKTYNERLAIGRIADQKKKFAQEMPVYEGVPSTPVSASELIKQQQDILAKNGENQRKRAILSRLEEKKERLQEKISQLEAELAKLKQDLTVTDADVKQARKTAEKLVDESTAELEKNISDIDEINRKIRANLDREKAETEAEGYAKQYETLSQKIEEIRTKRTKLLDNADMPLPDLSVVNGELTYKGYKWDGMSGSDQLKISTAIVRKLNPECGFVLLDKLEQMDTDTLSEFGKWLEKQGLQAIATRVSTGDECSIIIEDGYVKKEEVRHEKPAAVAWKPGEF